MKIEKQVTFDLSAETEITLPELTEKGYVRKHITALFEKLEAEGFGQYIKGKQGRGQSARFIKNENCPEKYLLILEQKRRGRPSKTVDLAVVEAVVNKQALEAEDCGEVQNLCEEEDLTDVASVLSMVRNDNVLLEVDEEVDEDVGEEEIDEENFNDIIS
jgi:hypothetical protein